jgi:hypothetical protein
MSDVFVVVRFTHDFPRAFPITNVYQSKFARENWNIGTFAKRGELISLN